MSPAEVEAAVGPPAQRPDGGPWRYEVGARVLLVHFDPAGTLLRVVETLPGGIENIVVQ